MSYPYCNLGRWRITFHTETIRPYISWKLAYVFDLIIVNEGRRANGVVPIENQNFVGSVLEDHGQIE